MNISGNAHDLNTNTFELINEFKEVTNYQTRPNKTTILP